MQTKDGISSSESSEVSSQPLNDFAKFSQRRFTELPLPGGGVFRVRSLKRSELVPKLRALPAERHYDVMIALAVVNHQGDTVWACSEESFVEHFDDMDFQIYDALYEGVKAFCTNPINYEELKKNS